MFLSINSLDSGQTAVALGVSDKLIETKKKVTLHHLSDSVKELFFFIFLFMIRFS